MGKNHARTYSTIPEANLCGISDLNEEAGTKIAEEFHSTYYKSFEEMLETENPEVVSVCVPTSLHHKIAKYCLEKGVNVLLEKPIAMTPEEGEDLIKTSKDTSSKLYIGHIERFNPAVKKVKEMIDNGDLGEITAVMARRVGGFPPQIKDANIAVDLGIHDIDIINYLLGELPQETHINKKKNHIEQREDSVEFFMKYSSASAYIQTNWITPVKIRKLNITGSEGYLEMDFISQQIEFYKSNYEKFKEYSGGFADYILRFSEPDKIVISVAKKEPLKEEILYFIDCVQNNKDIDIQFSIDALRIALT